MGVFLIYLGRSNYFILKIEKGGKGGKGSLTRSDDENR